MKATSTMEHSIFHRMTELGVEPYNMQQPIYKYRTLNRAVEILEKNELWFPNAIELAKYDKLELHPSLFDLSYAKETKEGYLKSLFERNQVGIDIDSVTDTEFEGLLKNSLHFCRSQVGIFSAGKSANNCFLWERYGDVHKGVCIGFVVPQFTIVSNLAFNAHYTDTPIRIPLLDPLEHHLSNDIFYSYCIKKPYYSNEEEVRIIDELATGAKPFNKGMLFEIILGADTTEKDFVDIKQALVRCGYNARIGKVKTDDTIFEMQIEYFN